IKVRTRQSDIRIAQAARTHLFVDDDPVVAERGAVAVEGLALSDHRVHLEEGRQLRVEKVVALFTSRDLAISESGEQACRRLETAGAFADLLDDHALAWKRIWNAHHLSLENDERSQMVLNLHIFHLLQTVSENTIDLDVG